ncbi:MAG: toxin-antitoxin system YwqK family antitoxin [Flavobacteriales bacterium]
MKYLLIFFSLLIAMPCVAQKPGTVWPKGKAGIDYNVKNSKGEKEGLWVRPHLGDTNIYSRGVFNNNKPVGIWEKYYPTGELELIQEHLAGDTVFTKKFHSDGITLASKGNYVKRRKEGKWLVYNESGFMINDLQMSDSTTNGLCKFYFENGKLWKTEVHKMGLKSGPFTEYFENGKKRAEGTYLLDEKEGDYTAWFDNGQMESRGKFVKGLMDGAWYYFNTDGTVKLTMAYSMGKELKRLYQNGTFTEHYDSGIPKSEYTYEDGMLDGPFKEYYDKGEYVLVEPDDPQFKGYQKLELQGTQIKVEGDYVKGKREGEVMCYSEAGMYEKTETWQAGVLVSTKKAGEN